MRAPWSFVEANGSACGPHRANSDAAPLPRRSPTDEALQRVLLSVLKHAIEWTGATCSATAGCENVSVPFRVHRSIARVGEVTIDAARDASWKHTKTRDCLLGALDGVESKTP